jgi:hypothetical protein
MEKLAEQQPRWAGSDDGNLGSHYILPEPALPTRDWPISCHGNQSKGSLP